MAKLKEFLHYLSQMWDAYTETLTIYATKAMVSQGDLCLQEA